MQAVNDLPKIKPSLCDENRRYATKTVATRRKPSLGGEEG